MKGNQNDKKKNELYRKELNHKMEIGHTISKYIEGFDEFYA